MIDEHTRESLSRIVERSITADSLVTGLDEAFAAAEGPPRVLRMENGPENHFHCPAVGWQLVVERVAHVRERAQAETHDRVSISCAVGFDHAR